MLEYLLDTNICIYIAKNSPAAVKEKFKTLSVGQVGMSCVTYAELLFGAEKSINKTRAIETVQSLTSLISPVDLGIEVALHYAEIRADLTRKGNIIGNNDLWIAAHCRSLGLTLVSNNIKEFNRVPDLKAVNWI